MILSLIVVTLMSACDLGHSARILGVVPSPSHSHQIVFRPIWRELSKRGHDLVVITTDPENDPKLNITEIDISFAYDLWTNKHDIIKQIGQFWSSPIKTIEDILNSTQDMCSQELLHPDVQALLKNDTEYFDLLIVEYMYPVMFGFAERFKCPYIGILTMDLVNFVHSMLGNPTHPVLYPELILPYEGELNFWQRLVSSICNLILPIFNIFSGLDGSAHQKLMEEHFGGNLPPVVDILKNVSMLFINVDPSSYTRPLGPAFIPIGGGTHLTTKKALAKVKNIYLYLDIIFLKRMW
ncbi:hypothetical protein NQ314_016366 [Rhamnusium bicolor]|uniref:Uncharacterized protein n=1 Tax=Rhamnusium bicolor TaxID=1586634 RepID=A0AAV8WVS9_9CUCU|nr:hypothetical protein NQ314_016366 [Rhamnusium bicolor]